MDGEARAGYGREVPHHGRRPGRDAERRDDRGRIAPVRPGESRRPFLADAAVGRPGVVRRPSLSRRALVAGAALGACLVLVSTAGGATRADSPTVTATETLVGLDAASSGGYEPPDVQVAAGPGFVVEMVNLAAQVWSTSAGSASQPVQTIGLESFFRTGGDRLTDPRVLYDVLSGRWFASVSDIDGSSVLLAVSQSADPTAAWSTYSFAASGCADQPRLGVADGIVVLAADVFSSCDDNFAPLLGSELWVVNKAQLVAGTADVASSTYGPDHSFQSLAPVQSLSSTGTEYVVSVDVPSSHDVHLLTVDGIPPAPVRVLPVASL